jgi:hypothetical protein
MKINIRIRRASRAWKYGGNSLFTCSSDCIRLATTSLRGLKVRGLPTNASLIILEGSRPRHVRPLGRCLDPNLEQYGFRIHTVRYKWNESQCNYYSSCHSQAKIIPTLNGVLKGPKVAWVLLKRMPPESNGVPRSSRKTASHSRGLQTFRVLTPLPPWLATKICPGVMREHQQQLMSIA